MMTEAAAEARAKSPPIPRPDGASSPARGGDCPSSELRNSRDGRHRRCVHAPSTTSTTLRDTAGTCAENLGRAFRVPDRKAPARQQTMRNAIGWSYDLLTDSEQRLVSAIGRLRWRLVDRSSGGGGQDLDELSRAGRPDLAGRQEPGALPRSCPMAPSRFTLLETMSEYALEQLAATDDWLTARARHAAYYRMVH